MTEIFKFFNSAPGDPREYRAADFADYFGSVLSTGLLHTDNVPGMAASVVAGTLTTQVTEGKAIMKGHLYENTAPLTLTHAIPEPTFDRIDRIVLRLDLRNAVRNIKLHVKEGVASASPIAPVLQRDNVIYEISLARVLVRKNTVQLLASDLVDERLDESLAGLVYSLISIPTSQFQAEWDVFMSSIVDSGFASQAEFAAHKVDYVSHNRYGVATGANAKSITLNPAPTILTEGFSLRFKNTTGNTGPVTLDINAVGPKPILRSGGVGLASGILKTGGIYTVVYDGTSFILQGEGGEYGTAVAGDVRIGKTIGTEYDGIVTGTMYGIKTSPGDATITISSTEKSTTSTTPIKLKEIKWNGDSGMLRLKFLLKSGSAGSSARGQIYINGVSRGILRNNNTITFVQYSEDFIVNKGDLLQLYSGVSGGVTIIVSDFSICVANTEVGTIMLE